MTLEVRQLVLRSSISDGDGEDMEPEGGAGAPESAGADCEEREQLKDEILAECRRWLVEHLQQQRER